MYRVIWEINGKFYDHTSLWTEAILMHCFSIGELWRPGDSFSVRSTYIVWVSQHMVVAACTPWYRSTSKETLWPHVLQCYEHHNYNYAIFSVWLPVRNSCTCMCSCAVGEQSLPHPEPLASLITSETSENFFPPNQGRLVDSIPSPSPLINLASFNLAILIMLGLTFLTERDVCWSLWSVKNLIARVCSCVGLGACRICTQSRDSIAFSGWYQILTLLSKIT